METDQFAALMPCISTDLVAMIMQEQGISAEEAIKKIYASKLYAALETEDTKVWHFSTQMLYFLLQEETATESIPYPDV